MNTLYHSYVKKLDLDIFTLYSKYVDSLKYHALWSTFFMFGAPLSTGLATAIAMGSTSPAFCAYYAPGICTSFVHLSFFINSYVKYHNIIKKINKLEQSTEDNSV